MRCETLEMTADGRLLSPSAERNKKPIAKILKQALPKEGLVLEVSSGTGQHVVHFARVLPDLSWQPSERDEDNLTSIAHWAAAEKLPNVSSPLRLDVTEQPWPIASAAAVVCLNMIHIAPWHAAEALVRGASEILPSGGPLFLYGPFRRNGRHTSESNEIFDAALSARNPAWGIRNLEDVARLAKAHGFKSPETHDMPANNLSVIFRKT